MLRLTGCWSSNTMCDDSTANCVRWEAVYGSPKTKKTLFFWRRVPSFNSHTRSKQMSSCNSVVSVAVVIIRWSPAWNRSAHARWICTATTLFVLGFHFVSSSLRGVWTHSGVANCRIRKKRVECDTIGSYVCCDFGKLFCKEKNKKFSKLLSFALPLRLSLSPRKHKQFINVKWLVIKINVYAVPREMDSSRRRNGSLCRRCCKWQTSINQKTGIFWSCGDQLVLKITFIVTIYAWDGRARGAISRR